MWARKCISMEARKTCWHVSSQARKARWQVSTQARIARWYISTESRKTREHVSMWGALAREHVSTQCTLAREHLSTQFSRLKSVANVFVAENNGSVDFIIKNWLYGFSLMSKDCSCQSKISLLKLVFLCTVKWKFLP